MQKDRQRKSLATVRANWKLCAGIDRLVLRKLKLRNLYAMYFLVVFYEFLSGCGFGSAYLAISVVRFHDMVYELSTCVKLGSATGAFCYL